MSSNRSQNTETSQKSNEIYSNIICTETINEEVIKVFRFVGLKLYEISKYHLIFCGKF